MKRFSSNPNRHLSNKGGMTLVVFLGITMAVLALVAIVRTASQSRSWSQANAASFEASGSAQAAGGSIDGAAIPTSTDLADFLVSATFNAPQNDSGQYVVTPGTSYSFRLSFQERYGGSDMLQFPDSATMTYAIPAGLAVDQHEGSFTIKIKDGTETYAITDNTYAIQDGTLRVNFNTDHPNFGELTATANTRFTLEFQGTLGEDAERILFSDGIEKDLSVDTTNFVTASKSAQFDKENNRVNYAVTIHSLGNSLDVHVKDVLTGNALSLDASSISATSSTNQPVTMTGSAQGNSFEYTIPSMTNNEFITFTYSADVNPAQIPGIDGKYSLIGRNEVQSWSVGDPVPDKREVNTVIDYTPTIDKSNGMVTAENGNTKTMTWVIRANQLPQVSMAGTTITDTIDAGSQGIMRYSGSGLTVAVRDAGGNAIRTDSISWNQLPNKTDSTWSYVVPEADANHAYSYEISYTTDVDLTGKTSVTTVQNGVVTSGGESASGIGQGMPAGGEVLVHKTATNVDLPNKEMTWNISFNVPADGLNVAEVTDTCPRAYDSDGTRFIEPVKDGSVSVTGLVDGETYSVASNSWTGMTVITFYKDQDKTQPGLRAVGERTVSVELKTEMSQDWLEASRDYQTDPGRGHLPTHTNTVQLQANDSYKVGSASTVVTLPEVAKTGTQVGTRTVNGIELPIYMYEIVVTGAGSDDLEIEDKFDTDLLTYYEGDYPDAGYVYGGTVHWQGTRGGKFNRLDTVNGMVISTNAACLPHDAAGGYFAGYRFVYYLTVKDAAAFNTIKERAAATDDGTYVIGNTAKFQDSTDGADITYQYDGLKKEILTPDSELKKVGEDIWVSFRVTLNGGGMLLNGGEDLVMTDTVDNLSVDVNSIRANPPSGVSWDMQGNTVTYTIPDGIPIVITYRARVIMPSVGEDGHTQQIHFSNHAEMKGYAEDINKTAEYTNSGYGSGSIAVINILKYRAGDMTQTLAGACFQLQDANGNPVRDKDGNPVEFTTDADGKITIKGDMQRLGWVLQEDTQYLIEEKLAPEGFMLTKNKYRFTVSSDGTTDYNNYIYYSGDTMTVKDYPGTDVRVLKVWADGNENHSSDEVVVRLQQRLGDGEWADTIRYENADGEWTDEGNMVVTLGASNGWETVFRALPLAVPMNIGDQQGSTDVPADYRVIEVAVNGEPLAEGILGTGGKAEGSGTYVYTVTNGTSTGELEITKSVQSDAVADHETEFEFVVTLKDNDGNTLTEIAGTHGDMTFDGGVATFKMKDTESKTATNLPLGIAYTVTETPTEGFIAQVDSDVTNEASGTISATKAIAAFHNTRTEAKKGGLTVEKTVNSHTAADKSAAYDFTVKLDDESINGQYGEMTFENGEAHFSLTDKDICDEDGKSTGIKTAENLPIGIKYTVTEVADGFTVASTGETGSIGIIPTPEEEPDATPAYPTATFVNTRDESEITLTKVVTGATAANTDKEYTVAIILKNADGSEATFVNDEHDGVDFDHGHAFVTLKAGDTKVITGLPQGLSYVVTEVIPDTEGDFVSGPPAGFTVSYTDQVGMITATGAFVTVTNAYEAEDETKLEAIKVLDGRPFAAGDEWKFTLVPSEGAPLPKDGQGNDVTQVTLAPSQGTQAPIDFGTIRYTLADLGGENSATFTYTITETTGKDETGEDKVHDVVNDSAKVVTIDVTDNGDGTLDIRKTVDGTDITSSNPLTFTNTYQVHEPLQVTKNLDGREWRSNVGDGQREQYGFELVATNDSLDKLNDSPINSVAYTDDETKPAVFGDLVFTTADAGKTYSYVIRELIPKDAINPSGTSFVNTRLEDGRSGPWVKNGVRYSDRQFEVRFEVATDDDGSLNVVRTCTPEVDGDIVFTNTYEAREVTQKVVATKSLHGRQLAAGDFEFRLYDVTRDKQYVIRNGYVTGDDGLPTMGDDASAITFDDIDAFDAAGEYTFMLSEAIPAGATRQGDGMPTLDGMSYDPTVYEVTINVTDDMLGHLRASEPIYRVAGGDGAGSAAAPTFSNSYFGAQADIEFGKYFYGNDANAKFNFTLEAAEGDDFAPRPHEAGDSVINEGTAYGDDNPLVDSGSAFRLSLTNEDAFDESDHVTVRVPTITYRTPGTYRYVITEDGTDSAMPGDTSEILVTVTVNEDATVEPVTYALRADGKVTSIDAQDAAFYNNSLVTMGFRARALSVQAQVEAARTARYMPQVRKSLANGILRGGEFSFTLYGGDGTPLSTVTNDVNGTVAFGTLTYGVEDVGQTYSYTISENVGTDASIRYDTHVITLKVQISEADDGSLVVTDTYYVSDETGGLVKTDDPTIINAYDNIVIHAVKRTREFNADGTINNDAEGLPGAHYGLWMVNPNGEDVYMGLGRNQIEAEGAELVSDEHGNLYYDIPPVQGVAYYLLEEAPAPKGHLVDPYPTDYFTLVRDENGFRLVYENDGPDASGKVFSDYVPTLGR